MLDRHELVVEGAHLVERAVEDAAQRGRRLWLPATRDRRELAETRLGLGTERVGPVARTVDERPRELLIEQRDRQVVGRELRVAGAPCHLLGGGDGLLALECQLVEVHVSSWWPGAAS